MGWSIQRIVKHFPIQHAHRRKEFESSMPVTQWRGQAQDPQDPQVVSAGREAIMFTRSFVDGDRQSIGYQGTVLGLILSRRKYKANQVCAVLYRHDLLLYVANGSYR